MATWTQLTVTVVQNAMPTDMAALYDAWLAAHPEKATRLAELVAEVLAIFRDAVDSHPQNQLNPDPATVPMTGFRHALNMVMFNLGMEMGVKFAPEVYALLTRADIWLRMVQTGGILVDSLAGEGTPSYEAPEGERAVEG